MGLESLGEWIKNKIDTYADYFKFWIVVDEFEEAIVLRNGLYNRTLKKGLHLKLPILEYFLTVFIKPDTIDIQPIMITTLDSRTVVVGLMVEYEIFDSRLFILENNDSISNMKDIARGALSDIIEDLSLEDMGKKTTKNKIEKQLKQKFESMGVKVINSSFTHKYNTTTYNITSPEMVRFT